MVEQSSKMKKFLIVFFCTIMPASAAMWQQYAPKGWYDYTTWNKNGNIATMWFKDLNPGDWDLIEKKKVWYRITQMQANCGNNMIQIVNATDYDLKGKVISSVNFTDTTYYENGRYYTESNWQYVVPDSVGEYKYKLMCSYR